MKIRSALIAAACTLITNAASAQEIFSSGPINLPIVDGVTTSGAIIGGHPLQFIADADVLVNLTHTYDSDLDIVLVAPNGASYVHLCSDVGGDGQNMIGTIFDDQAPTSIISAVAPMTGSFRPEDGPINWTGTVPLPATALPNLAALNGTDSFGGWTLLVHDDAAQDVGVLLDWALIFSYLPNTPPQISFVVTPASIVPGGTAIVRAQVTPGTAPPSTSYGFSVMIDGFDATHRFSNFRDDGVYPDFAAGDNYFAAQTTIAQNAQPGITHMTIDLVDDWNRRAFANGTYEVLEGAPGACCIGGECSIRSWSDCLNAGGSFGGGGTTCQNEEYTFSTAGGPFEDISGSGIIGPTGDDSVVDAPIGFNFPFYGNTYSSLFINSNGMISFGAGSNEWINTAIPSLATPNNAIYALWDDLNPEAGGHIYYRSLGSPGVNQRFIVMWQAVPQFNTNDANTFEIILYPTGQFDLRYGQISTFTDADATIGVENVLGTGASTVQASTIFIGTSKTALYQPRTCPSTCLWHVDGCFADYTNDGGIDSDDVISFFTDWDAGSACADVDLSGGTDSDDVISFFGLWDASGAGNAGC